MPESIINPILFFGTFERCIMADGTNTIPAEKIRTEAICHPFNATLLNFIKINELPQINERKMKISQLIILSFAIKEIANVHLITMTN